MAVPLSQHSGRIGDRDVHGDHGADNYGDFPRPVDRPAPKRLRMLSLIVGRS